MRSRRLSELYGMQEGLDQGDSLRELCCWHCTSLDIHFLSFCLFFCRSVRVTSPWFQPVRAAGNHFLYVVSAQTPWGRIESFWPHLGWGEKSSQIPYGLKSPWCGLCFPLRREPMEFWVRSDLIWLRLQRNPPGILKTLWKGQVKAGWKKRLWQWSREGWWRLEPGCWWWKGWKELYSKTVLELNAPGLTVCKWKTSGMPSRFSVSAIGRR